LDNVRDCFPLCRRGTANEQAGEHRHGLHFHWYEAVIYRTKGGCLVIQVVFHTTADGELDHYFAKVTSPDRIADDFRGYNPMMNVLGRGGP